MSKKNTGRPFTRQQNEVERHDRVLIVCEDSKSSPNYFEELVKHERLSSVDVKITGDCGSDPISVVNKAIELYEESVNDDNLASTFDMVYCVIDRDGHQNFEQAIDKHNSHCKNGKPFHMVRSYPCFEFWYLCHFIFTRTSIGNTGTKSSADKCIQLLNKEWTSISKKKYEKNQTGIYKLLYSKLEVAMGNAKGTLKSAIDTNEMNPSTEVHELVHYLINIRSTSNIKLNSGK